jgi:hypothetical protein
MTTHLINASLMAAYPLIQVLVYRSWGRIHHGKWVVDVGGISGISIPSQIAVVDDFGNLVMVGSAS